MSNDSTYRTSIRVFRENWEPILAIVAILFTSAQSWVVYRQLKLTEEAAHAQTHQDMMRDILVMNKDLAAHPRLARQLSDDIEPNWSDTLIDEAFVVFNIIVYYENVWYQHEHGTITEDVWNTWQVFMIETVQKPLPYLVWQKTLRYFNPKFNAWVEKQIAMTSAPRERHAIVP